MPSNFFNLNNNLPFETGRIGGLSDAENIDLNIHYLIKEIIFPLNGYVSTVTETINPGNQIVDQETGLLLTQYQSSFVDWCYYNPLPSHPSLTGLITSPILNPSGSLSHIDYQNGIVYYSGVLNNTITANYSFYNVFVQDGEPEQYDIQYLLDTLRLPAISIDSRDREDYPRQIGGDYARQRTFVINILANSDAQKYDILDILENSLRYTYSNTIDYRIGLPTLFNGNKDPAFNRSNKWLPFYFKTESARPIRNPKLQEKLRHQAEITLIVTSNEY